MKTEKILAIDPGGMTGIVRWNGEKVEQAVEIPGDEIYAFLKPFLLHSEVVVIEKFKIYPSTSIALGWGPADVAELIGAVKYGAWLLRIPVVMQEPAARRPFQFNKGDVIDGQKLGKHSSDAFAHLLYYLNSQGHTAHVGPYLRIRSS